MKRYETNEFVKQACRSYLKDRSRPFFSYHRQRTIDNDNGGPLHDKISFSGRQYAVHCTDRRRLEKSFVMEDWLLIGPNYDKTLMAWLENFDSG